MTNYAVPTTQILEVATAAPAHRYSQQDLLLRFGLEKPGNQRFFKHPHIETRHLILPRPESSSARLREETPGQLLEKFKCHAVDLGSKAVSAALAARNLGVRDVAYLCCVSSTGFIVPGLSALICAHLGLPPDCQRLDIVGMGCHGGLNGLNAVNSWCRSHPGQTAILACVEICSAIYATDETENTALVNSLFGDGVAAAVLRAGAAMDDSAEKVEILGFASHLIPNTARCLRFDYDDEKHRHRFYVGKETPKVLAEHICEPVSALLRAFSVDRSSVAHWLFHSGGAAILDGIEKRLELKADDLRHTRSVLRDFGNVSSGAFLFSYERLIDEGRVKSGDLGVMATMGPGLTIETALLRWR